MRNAVNYYLLKCAGYCRKVLLDEREYLVLLSN